MPRTRNSIGKRQTRLAFTPLPSSSPAAKNYPDQIQQRAAAVRYEDPTSPSRRLRSKQLLPSDLTLDGGNISSVEKMTLPTPAASSQANCRDELGQNDSSSTSDSSAQTDMEVPLTSRIFGRYARPPVDSDREILASNPPKSSKINLKSPRLKPEPASEPDTLKSSSDDEILLPRNRKSRLDAAAASLRRGNASEHPSAPRSPEDQGSSAFKNLSSCGRTLRSSAARSQNHIEAKIGGTASNRGTRSSTSFHHHPNTAKIEAMNSVGTIQAQPKSQRSLRSSRPITTNYSIDDIDDLERDLTKGNKAAEMTPIKKGISSASEKSAESPVITPKRRRLFLRKAQASSSTNSDEIPQQDAADLQEDMEDLRESDVRKNRTRGKKFISNINAVKQKQLEILRRRRAGNETIELSSDSEVIPQASASPSRDLNVDNQGTENEVSKGDDGSSAEDEFSEDDASGTEAIRQALRANSDEDDSCVDYDGDGTLGAPEELHKIPIEFTHHVYKKPIENFKITVEWMVHNKLHPAFARHDMIYKIAASRLNDEVKGYTGSKFVSTAWNGDFLKVLKARPELSVISVPTMHDHKCDACNRSGHPAKHQLVFSGKLYRKETLEETDEEDDEYDANGQEKTQSFFLGRTCAANAETSHSLLHWRIHLNFYVLNWLKNQGHITVEKIIERENWTNKKRERYSNDVVDGMERTGEMKRLYKEFKENLEAARSARPERFTYGRR